MIEIKAADGNRVYARPDQIVAIIIANRFGIARNDSAKSVVIIAGGQVPIQASVSEQEAERVLTVLRELNPASFVDAKPAGLVS